MPSSPSQETPVSGARHSHNQVGRQEDLPEECRFLLNTQLMFLKKESPTSKQFDDDEWIRSLTEAQEVSADPEDSVTYEQQDVDPKKVRPFQMGEFLQKYVSRRLFGPQ